MFRRSKNILFIILFLCCTFPVSAQESFRVMFWNVENLFDTKDDPHKNDNEYLPESIRHWTFFRYWEKIRNLSKGIIASGEDYVPDLVGLCEVENDSCLYDLTRRSPLKEAGYRYVVTDSPDQRGIDVALLYQRGSFKLIQHQSVRIPSKQIKKSPTRDVLHVVGKVISGDSLDVFVVHLPSRRGGKAKSEQHRLLVAEILKQTVDSIMLVRQHPNVVIMGDFNDGPSGSVMKIFCSDGQLVNLMHGKKEGTYRYRGNWEILDQFLVSPNVYAKHTEILRCPFLLEEDEKYGGDKPFRTYNGMNYQGGFSDHLPIVLDLEMLIRDDKDYYSE